MTLGIVPTSPETGYGYLEADMSLRGLGPFPVTRFVEKPDRATALAYLEAGTYFWNSGMFVWRADTILSEIGRYMPELAAQLERMTFGDVWDLADLTAQIADIYAAIAGQSIDYGVMEQSDRVQMVPADIGWSDVGSWSALPEVTELDAEGTVVANCSRYVNVDSSGCIVSGNGHVVARWVHDYCLQLACVFAQRIGPGCQNVDSWCSSRRPICRLQGGVLSPFFDLLVNFSLSGRLTMPLQLLSQRLEKTQHDGLYPRQRSVERTTPQGFVEGLQALLFCSKNYMGLAEHPSLAQAAADAALQYGTSSAASRLVSGNQPLHAMLEAKLSAWKGTETALLFNSGYAANTGIIAALAGRGDIIFSDRLNHASIIDGALLSGARLIRYPHNDTLALARLLEQHQTDGLRLIVTDGVFSMDGDIAPLQGIADLAEQHRALLMVDDAHAGGVLGQQGRGTVDFCGVTGRVAIQMGTFGKALGSFGAYAACSRLVRDYLINRSRSLIFSTSLPPAVLAASAAAVELVQEKKVSNYGSSLQITVTCCVTSCNRQATRCPMAAPRLSR